MITKGAPSCQTEPEVNISGMGESVVDPETLLSYAIPTGNSDGGFS